MLLITHRLCIEVTLIPPLQAQAAKQQEGYAKLKLYIDEEIRAVHERISAQMRDSQMGLKACVDSLTRIVQDLKDAMGWVCTLSANSKNVMRICVLTRMLTGIATVFSSLLFYLLSHREKKIGGAVLWFQGGQCNKNGCLVLYHNLTKMPTMDTVRACINDTLCKLDAYWPGGPHALL